MINPDSLKTITAKVEPRSPGEPGFSCQFERIGYFIADAMTTSRASPVFNRTVALRDSWGKK